MRNKYYKDDQIVFTFINSGECTTYGKLKDFLIKNSLPLLERWAFYFFGKTSSIDMDSIRMMGEDKSDKYGGYLTGEVFHWKRFLSNDTEKSTTITLLEVQGIEINNVTLSTEYIKRGWKFVFDSLEWDKECQKEHNAEDFYSSYEVSDELFNDYKPDWDPFENNGNWGHGDGY